MSRLGKKGLRLPAGVKYERAGQTIKLTGPRGVLSRGFDERIKIELIEPDSLRLTPTNQAPATRALWGTTAAHLANLITGVTQGFSRSLIIEGLGYKAAVTGDKLVLNLGFSHPIEVPIPSGITVAVDKNTLTISGLDCEMVGQFAAGLRARRPPEPYKGTGVRYSDEVVRRKAGKRVVST